MNYKIGVLQLAIVFITFACNVKKPEFSNIRGTAQGSTYSIVYENPEKINPEELKLSVEKIIHNFDLSLSLYKDSSIISKVNRNEDIAVDTFFIEVYQKSRKISIMTDGAFDITVGPLVRAWGFGPDAHKTFDITKLDSLLKLVGYEKITLRDSHLIKSEKGIQLDVNAIAQGYSVDVLTRYLKGIGLKNFLIEVGGEVRATGSKAGEFWKIGIDKPFDNNMSPGENLQAIIKIKDNALATSGNYRKFYEEDGVKYSHEIDPKSGYPARNRLLSVTIITEECAMADGLATACMVMGMEKSIDLIKKYPGIEAFLVYSDDNGNFRTWITDNLRNNITGNNEN